MNTAVSDTRAASRAAHTALTAGGLVLVAWVLVSAAWMSDDAFITLRTIDNFVHGYGLRWNVAERVQAFTHPAWLVLLTPFYAITHEPFFTTLALQLALALATVLLVVRVVARSSAQACLAIACFISSKALVDFSTSGLENPLTHFLLASIFLVWRSEPGRSRVTALTALVACAVLCRAELVLLLAPVLIAATRRREPALIARVAMGSLPLVGWEIFSLVYYGALVPNTALAKLSTGIPAGDLLRQGWHYWQATLLFDPVTPLAIVGGATLLMFAYGTRGRVMSVGLLLYTGFVLSVGGDFMSGRFLTPLLMWALIGLVGLTPSVLLSPRALVLAAALVVAGGALVREAPLYNGARFGARPLDPFDHFGVTDERRFYYPTMGLLPRLGLGERPTEPLWKTAGKSVRARGPQLQVIQASNVGLFGYWAGPNVHVIDRNALGDPFLARLPAKTPWRIGHFTRVVPEGYMETWRTGTNALIDPRLRQLYDQVRIVTQDPIWSRSRFHAIVRLMLRHVP